MTHGGFIKALGGGTIVAAWVSEESQTDIDREAVYKWSNNGVPWRWRPYLAKMAKKKGVRAPKDFFPGVTA